MALFCSIIIERTVKKKNNIIMGGAMNNTESKVFILDQTTIKKLLTIFKLVIPDFQRNFVWKKKKKEQLLASLFRGFPIGAITLYQDGNSYYVIDGLQRINTLKQYLSCPGAIISFETFYKKAESDIMMFLEQRQLTVDMMSLKKCIKKWYESLGSLYEFEKVSVFYGVLKTGNAKIVKAFDSLGLVEELLDILKSKVEIAYDDIALIIYKGSKEDLPDLFKNINTGSVALSQYEILQSVWNDYVLDSGIVRETSEAFNRELELISDDYEIDAVKEAGKFDVFKNIVGLNHIICCKEDSNIIFRFSGYKNAPKQKNGIIKYYGNDSIAFEIYSTILCNTPNKIVEAVDLLYKNHDIEQVSQFVNRLNKIILKAVDVAIDELKRKNMEPVESKYHSLYILAGIIFSRFDIDARNLTLDKAELNTKIYYACLDIERHKKYKWFVDENRQVGFFNIKIENLLEMKEGDVDEGEKNENRIAENQLKIRIEDKIIIANTVKDFYRKIFLYLEEQFDMDAYIPYATGKKRYLVNRTKYHINGDLFVAPIKVGDYYIETHKSRSGALRDIYNYLKKIDVDAAYVE